uniref:Ribonuclease Y n=1 Tax=candidate division WOR-3 bacterium TaxID=2052148 RepID=A0A7C4GAT2_UNCW3
MLRDYVLLQYGLFFLLPLVLGGVGFWVGFVLSRRAVRSLLAASRQQADGVLAAAEAEAQRLRERAEAERKEEWYREKVRFEAQTAAARRELERLEQKLAERESFLARRDSVLTQKEADLIRKDRDLAARERLAKAKLERLDQLIEQENLRLERIAGLSSEEAKRELFRNLESQARLEAAQIMRDIKDEARARAETEAREIIAAAIQRCAVSHSAETTVSVVNLPNDDIKGRIIGREGRNIRTFESLTGVEVMIDDTPGAIIISGFDPVRREIAKLAMEKLVADGRIHPARIEEVVGRTREETEQNIRATGEGVVLELGIVGLHPELSRMLGRLRFRTSYGQNVLLHSKEVAFIASMMAQELELDPAVAKRAGLLHDIGKAADQTVEGPHAQIGAELCRRYGEEPVVVNAVAAHHEETTLDSPYAFLVAAADSVSGSRPGARRESFDTYIKRIESLETIACSFPGVEKAYAVQAGREIRVLVEPDKVSDHDAAELAAKVAAQIESELQYPGQIRVMVIRETRAVNYAR